MDDRGHPGFFPRETWNWGTQRETMPRSSSGDRGGPEGLQNGQKMHGVGREVTLGSLSPALPGAHRCCLEGAAEPRKVEQKIADWWLIHSPLFFFFTRLHSVLMAELQFHCNFCLLPISAAVLELQRFVETRF